ncbi:MAG: hypothetical protein ACRCZF_05590, partial [Gemmataceae bacterium]
MEIGKLWKEQQAKIQSAKITFRERLMITPDYPGYTDQLQSYREMYERESAGKFFPRPMDPEPVFERTPEDKALNQAIAARIERRKQENKDKLAALPPQGTRVPAATFHAEQESLVQVDGKKVSQVFLDIDPQSLLTLKSCSQEERFNEKYSSFRKVQGDKISYFRVPSNDLMFVRGRTQHFIPVQALRPMVGTIAYCGELENLQYAEGTEIVDGRRCYIFKHRDQLRFPGRFTLSPTQGYAIVRFREYKDMSNEFHLIQASYTEHPVAGWIPEKWQTQKLIDGKIVHELRAERTSFECNVAYPAT